MQLVREHSVTVIWARLATVDWSSELAEPLWTDPGPNSGISVLELMSTLKKKKKEAQAGKELLNILHKSLQARKKPLCRSKNEEDEPRLGHHPEAGQ